MNPESLLNNLRDLYGNKLTSAHIKAYCAQHDVTYQTVTKYLQQFKTTKGKWNLTVKQKKEKLENSFSAPAVVPPTEQNLVPAVDPNFVKFGNFADVKKDYSI